ncbi:MAG: hypothetical protein HY335_05015 [Deinococcus sp.]|nr:hypothetical protein [Deinococcus sp.]
MSWKLAWFVTYLLVLACLPHSMAGDDEPTLQLRITQPSALVFNLNTPAAGQVYPPTAFPAFYTPTSPSTTSAQRVNLEITVSGSGTIKWRVLVSGLPFAPDFPVDRLEYVMSGSNTYVRLSSSQQLFTSGSQKGTIRRRHNYRLRLEGNEPPGSFQTTVTYTLVSP